jgi:hypothetical protein
VKSGLGFKHDSGWLDIRVRRLAVVNRLDNCDHLWELLRTCHGPSKQISHQQKALTMHNGDPTPLAHGQPRQGVPACEDRRSAAGACRPEPCSGNGGTDQSTYKRPCQKCRVPGVCPPNHAVVPVLGGCVASFLSFVSLSLSNCSLRTAPIVLCHANALQPRHSPQPVPTETRLSMTSSELPA